jgi:hypothetical protein
MTMVGNAAPTPLGKEPPRRVMVLRHRHLPDWATTVPDVDSGTRARDIALRRSPGYGGVADSVCWSMGWGTHLGISMPYSRILR